MFTTIEGEWDECMAVVKACVDAVAAHGPRVGLVLKADIRPGRTGELQGKLEPARGDDRRAVRGLSRPSGTVVETVTVGVGAPRGRRRRRG